MWYYAEPGHYWPPRMPIPRSVLSTVIKSHKSRSSKLTSQIYRSWINIDRKECILAAYYTFQKDAIINFSYLHEYFNITGGEWLALRSQGEGSPIVPDPVDKTRHWNRHMPCTALLSRIFGAEYYIACKTTSGSPGLVSVRDFDLTIFSLLR